MSTARAALHYAAATSKKSSAKNTLYLHCSVKPGASRAREGVASLDDEAVGICVAAQAREGEATALRIQVLSEVRAFTGDGIWFFFVFFGVGLH